jgi:hypothetical protein
LRQHLRGEEGERSGEKSNKKALRDLQRTQSVSIAPQAAAYRRPANLEAVAVYKPFSFLYLCVYTVL